MQMSYYFVHLAAQALFFVHCIVKTEMVHIYIKVCQGSRVMFNNLNHHLQFNQAKTELLVFPAPPTLQHDFTIQMDSATITPSSSVRDLGGNFQWPAHFQRPHCKNCSILPVCIAQHQKDQALVISRLDYSNALLARLPAQSNLYRWFRMQRHDWSSANPKEPMSHLSLSPCTGSRLQLASSSRHRCLHIEQAQHPPTSTPEAWELRVSNTSWCHHREAQNRSPGRFHSPFLAGGMHFSPRSGMLNPWQFSSDTWKLISSIFTWLHLKKQQQQKKHTFALSLNLSLSS